MTLQEIKERIAAYESKWGKLGHTNIMKPENEIQHSALNERRNTMIKTTNDFYKFRQKVAIGKEANKLAHKATISPEELNERNFQNQIDNNTLIHAGKNFKYVAKEDINGKPRYFYTQEEYDAYKRGDQTTPNASTNDYKQRSQASEDFKRENDERWAYEVSKNRKSGSDNWEREMLANEKGKQMDKDLGYVDKIKEDLSKGVRRVIRRDDNPVGELMEYIEDAFDDNKLRMDEKGNMTGDEKVIAKIQEMSKEAEKYGKNLADNFGTEGSKNVWDEFQKQTEDKISFLTRAYNVKDEALKAYDEGGEDAVAEYLINTDEWKDFEKEVRKLIGAGKVRINRDNSGYSKMSNEDSDIISNLEEKIEDYVEIIGDGTGIKRSAIRKLLDKEIMNFAMARSEDKYEANSNGKDNYNSGDKKFANTNKETDEYTEAKVRKIVENDKRRRENISKNDGSRSGLWYGGDNNPERDRYAKIKHSSINDEREIPSYIGASDIRAAKEESIMSEYRAFKARANKGAEKNRLSHSAVISPRDLNAKYEEELMKEYIAIHPENDDFESLSHSGKNFKYYNKIDLPNGTTRYFYTKAEWDAYQREKGSKTNTDQKLSEETLKQIEQEKQQKDTFEKNKAADEAQKKAESDKWNTHKKIREDFHQVPGYMSYSSRFTDTMNETPEGSKEGKDYLFNVMYDAYKKYPKMKNIRTISSNQKDKPKDEEVFGFMDEIQKGIDKYTSDFINKYELPKEEYTPLINNYFLSMANNLMKDNALDYDYISDVYYRNSDVGKKETKAQEILKQGDFRDHVFPEQIQNTNMIEGLNRSTGEELVEKTDHSATYKLIDRDTDEQYQAALKSFAETRQAQYIKEEYDNLKNRRTNDGKQQYSDEDIYNAIYKFLHRNVQQWAVKQNDFNPNIFYLIPDLLKTMGINGEYTADPQDLILKVK